MGEQIFLRNARKDVDKKYVGFSPNGSSVKPVHIAGGSLRCIYGGYNRTMCIKHLALVSDAKGRIPAGNESNKVYTDLLEEEHLEEGVSENSVESMRNVMQRLLSADKGVYVVKGLKDGMLSYSAGSKYFLTSKAMYEEAGEFIGGIVRDYCPELAEYIKGILEEANDPISLLFEPVLEMDTVVFADQSQHEDIPAFKNPNAPVEWFVNGIQEAGTALLDNFEHHTNPLMQLRLFNLFCVFQLIRYMTLLSTFYCDEPIRPILLDFSGMSPSMSSVARASEMSYTQIYKAVNRFYAWGYATWLDENGFDKTSLMISDTPIYEEGKPVNKGSKEELDALWSLAKDRASELSDGEALLAFGETMYDMLALQASAHPVVYLRALGTNSGILYPPDKLHPNKRFSVSQDVLEMLLRCCVDHDEVITGSDIRLRLWNRFGIIVGQSQFETEKLKSGKMILQIEEDALESNFSFFADKLEAMDFAEIMADGILQIRFGGSDK